MDINLSPGTSSIFLSISREGAKIWNMFGDPSVARVRTHFSFVAPLLNQGMRNNCLEKSLLLWYQVVPACIFSWSGNEYLGIFVFRNKSAWCDFWKCIILHYTENKVIQLLESSKALIHNGYSLAIYHTIYIWGCQVKPSETGMVL